MSLQAGVSGSPARRFPSEMELATRYKRESGHGAQGDRRTGDRQSGGAQTGQEARLSSTHAEQTRCSIRFLRLQCDDPGVTEVRPGRTAGPGMPKTARAGRSGPSRSAMKLGRTCRSRFAALLLSSARSCRSCLDDIWLPGTLPFRGLTAEKSGHEYRGPIYGAVRNRVRRSNDASCRGEAASRRGIEGQDGRAALGLAEGAPLLSRGAAVRLTYGDQPGRAAARSCTTPRRRTTTAMSSTDRRLSRKWGVRARKRSESLAAVAIESFGFASIRSSLKTRLDMSDTDCQDSPVPTGLSQYSHLADRCLSTACRQASCRSCIASAAR